MKPEIAKVTCRTRFCFLGVFLILGKGSLINSFSTIIVSRHTNAIGVHNICQRTNGIYNENSRLSPHRRPCIYAKYDDDDIVSDRRDLLQQSSLLAAASFLSSTAFAWNIAPQKVYASDDVQVIKTESGLKYIDLEVGKGPAKTPQYGQLCVISYTGYFQLPNDSEKKKFASQTGFVLKHGNGRLIAGLDEGLHTMKRGGRRRLIIPPKLGFVVSGLGPLPEMPWQRETLNSLLTEMVKQRGGNLIYDVKLERFFDDEADQGYYQDDEISPEEFAELNRRLNRKNGALDSVGDDIDIMERDREKPIV